MCLYPMYYVFVYVHVIILFIKLNLKKWGAAHVPWPQLTVRPWNLLSKPFYYTLDRTNIVLLARIEYCKSDNTS